MQRQRPGECRGGCITNGRTRSTVDPTGARLARRRSRGRSDPRAADERRSDRRGWLMRRMLVLADLVGLTLRTSRRRSLRDGRPPDAVSSQVELLVFLVEPAGLGDRGQALRPLRLRRGAHGPLNGRRPRRRSPSRHGRQLAALRLRRGHAPCRPRLPRLLGFWLLAIVCITAGRAIARWIAPEAPRLRPEHDHRRRGRRGPARREEAPPAPEYGLNLVGVRGRQPQGADGELRTSRSSAVSSSFRRWCRSSTSSA